MTISYIRASNHPSALNGTWPALTFGESLRSEVTRQKRSGADSLSVSTDL